MRPRRSLELVFVAGFLAIALGPPVDFLERRRVKRGFAILLVYLGIVAGDLRRRPADRPAGRRPGERLSKDIPGYVKDLRKSEHVPQVRRQVRHLQEAQRAGREAAVEARRGRQRRCRTSPSASSARS